MIRCNLAVLLAERNLRISKVSKDTGISRTTLTSLNNNYSQGIQFDTMNTLCLYLGVVPEKLISYIPFDMEITSFEYDTESGEMDIQLEITTNNKNKKNYQLFANVNKHYSEKYYIIEWLEVEMGISEYKDIEFNNHNQEISKYLKELPQPFISDFEGEITERLYKAIEREDTLSQTPDVTFEWRSAIF